MTDDRRVVRVPLGGGRVLIVGADSKEVLVGMLDENTGEPFEDAEGPPGSRLPLEVLGPLWGALMTLGVLEIELRREAGE